VADKSGGVWQRWEFCLGCDLDTGVMVAGKRKQVDDVSQLWCQLHEVIRRLRVCGCVRHCALYDFAALVGGRIGVSWSWPSDASAGEKS
jgi:hypothetical protein